MSIGKVKMKGTKPVLEVTKQPRDTGEFEKIEIPNKKIQGIINKANKQLQVIPTPTGPRLKVDGSVNVSDKEAELLGHYQRHQFHTEEYSKLNRSGYRAGSDPYKEIDDPEFYRGFHHYQENVDADKQLYDYLMDTTGGNGEKKK